MDFKERMNHDIYVEEKVDKEKNKKRDTEIIIVVACCCTALFSYFFNQVISCVILGIMFLLLGIIELRFNNQRNVYPENYFLPAAFIVLSLILFPIPLIGMLLWWSGQFSDNMMMDAILSVEGILLLLLGLLITAYPVYYISAKKRRCTCCVTATCLAPVFSRYGGKGGNYYEHLWEFQLNGELVRITDHIVAQTQKPYAGTIENFIVNPNDLNDLYRKRPFRIFIFMLTGIGLCLIAMLLLIPSFIMLFQ